MEKNKQFWDDIILNKDGTVNIEQVYKELSDFSTAVEHCEEVYDYMSWWRISKCMTYPKEVINIFEDRYVEKNITRDDMILFIRDYEWKELEEKINEYFQ